MNHDSNIKSSVMINMFKNDQHDTLVPSLLSHWGQGERLAPKSPRERVPVVLPEPVQAGSMRAARPVSEPCLPPPRTRFGQVTRHDCDASELQPRRSARGFDPPVADRGAVADGWRHGALSAIAPSPSPGEVRGACASPGRPAIAAHLRHGEASGQAI